MVKTVIMAVIFLVLSIFVGARIFNDGNPYSGILYVLIVGFIIYQIYIKKLINK